MVPPVSDRLSPIAPSPVDGLPDPAQRVMPLRQYVIAIGVLGSITVIAAGVLATAVLALIGRRVSGSGLIAQGVPSAVVAVGLFAMAWRSVLIGFRDALPVVGDVHRVGPDMLNVLLHWEYVRVIAGLAAAFVVIGLIFGGPALQVFPLVIGLLQASAGAVAARLVRRRERAQGRRYLVRIELAESNAERELLWEPEDERTH